NGWRKKINIWLELDCMTMHDHFGRKATSKGLVLQTWAGSILNKHQFPKDWMESVRVLVHIG
ncbi:uncharacterized protein BT62DRAFT_901407, partial [Guyanagaster necrorhizus]